MRYVQFSLWMAHMHSEKYRLLFTSAAYTEHSSAIKIRLNFIMEANTMNPDRTGPCCLQYTCPDPESFVKGGPNSTLFCVFF